MHRNDEQPRLRLVPEPPPPRRSRRAWAWLLCLIISLAAFACWAIAISDVIAEARPSQHARHARHTRTHHRAVRHIYWHRAGASLYGEPCEAGTKGYRGDYLPALTHSFAELDMGTALGGLPYKARIEVLDPVTHRRAWIYKRDIGLGGGAIAGIPRAIDLFAPFAEWLTNGAGCSWTGVILWRQ